MTTILLVVYGIGFLVTPFVWSLIDGWPFAKPRLDGLDMSAMFFIALFWPVTLVCCGLYIWWVFCSAIGAKMHKAIVKAIEKAIAKVWSEKKEGEST